MNSESANTGDVSAQKMAAPKVLAADVASAEVAGAVDLRAFEPSEVVKKFQRKAGDTGSPEVQIALITRRLQQLGDHFKKHVQDTHSQRGMMELISHRKQLLHYLKTSELPRYKSLIASLGLRK